MTVLNFDAVHRHELHEFTRIIILVLFVNSCYFVKFVAVPYFKFEAVNLSKLFFINQTINEK